MLVLGCGSCPSPRREVRSLILLFLAAVAARSYSCGRDSSQIVGWLFMSDDVVAFVIVACGGEIAPARGQVHRGRAAAEGIDAR